ncbi:hypothetical protein C3K47_10655 [Solitalea longa]|uniref:Peptidoglycan peptidase n=1 Tax=Solitalea longa TaxID=2079460 RepID=A0A2S5A1M9_9SPHI|nr:YiiX/YebB-like N1pC/P60 family cysteine hydrolase [Solitalea longa]POY36209.1 hypothetical protein C3K47_10655 [Solitalea longa]
MIRGICFAIAWVLLFSSNVCAQTLDNIQLKNGDLLFEDLDCGPLCDAIEQVTQSYGDNHFSHIGLVYWKADSVFIIEAIGAKVQLTPLEKFTGRTIHKIYIGRPIVKQEVIENAIQFSVSKLGVEYDDNFLYDNGKYYCSELIYDAFKYANLNKDFFKLEPMTFKKPGSNEFFPVWIDYYKDLGAEIPEGKLGINPGGISRSNKIEILNP